MDAKKKRRRRDKYNIWQLKFNICINWTFFQNIINPLNFVLEKGKGLYTVVKIILGESGQYHTTQ